MNRTIQTQNEMRGQSELAKCSRCAFSGMPELDITTRRIVRRCHLQASACIPSWTINNATESKLEEDAQTSYKP